MFLKRKRLGYASLIWSAFAMPVMAQDTQSGAPEANQTAATATDNASAAKDSAEAAPASAETPSDANAQPVVTDVVDPAFDRYVDLTLLAPAVEEADAATLTDLALQAAFGESILERSHKAVTSKELASLALKVALDSNDEKSLDRLAKLAEKSGNDDLKTKISMQRKLGSASRSAPEVMVSLDQMSVDGLRDFKDYVKDIELAVRLGDRLKLEEIRKSDFSALPAELQKKIADLLTAADEKLSEDGDALAKLVGVSRECKRQQPPVTPPGGYGPPTLPSGGYGPPVPPSGGYGPPVPPSGGYGPPTPPSGGYGPPTTPAGYVPPTRPPGGYVPPTRPPGGYVPPTTPPGGYVPPTTPPGGYVPPTTPPGGYVPPTTPPGGYVPPTTPPAVIYGRDPNSLPPEYQESTTPAAIYGRDPNSLPPEYQDSVTPPGNSQESAPLLQQQQSEGGSNLQNELAALPQLIGALSQLGGTSRGGEDGYATPPTTNGGYGQPGQPNAYGPPASGGGYGQPSQPNAYGPPASSGGYGQPSQPTAYGAPASGTGYGKMVVKYQRGPAYATGSLTGSFEQTGQGTWVERNCKGVHQCREVSRNGSVLVLERTGTPAGQRYRIDLAKNEIVDYAAPNISYKIIPPASPPGYQVPGTPSSYTPPGYQVPGTPSSYTPPGYQVPGTPSSYTPPGYQVPGTPSSYTPPGQSGPPQPYDPMTPQSPQPGLPQGVTVPSPAGSEVRG